MTVVLDDFGTGSSSLRYLRQFPVDVLKIDKSFIAALGRKPEERALVRMLVELGRTLNLRTIAEGIEAPEQLEHLREAGCELGQGCLFAPPMDDVAMTSHLALARQT